MTTRRSPACQADKCQHGHASCPAPQACEVADATDVGHAGAESVPGSPLAGMVLTILAVLGVAGLIVELASNH